MRPLRRRLAEYSRLTGLRLDAIQQDYLLTWLLQEISLNRALSDQLIFKGGTALKKCYFGEYRFSEDLDFSSLPNAPRGSDLEAEIFSCCTAARDKIREYEAIDILCQRYREREPHPDGQEAFVIRAQFPWQREPLTRVMIEVTQNETILFPPIHQRLLHSYEEPIEGEILTYSVGEIVLEKLRAILQHTKKLHERDWGRSRARDYYDLWHLLCKNKGPTPLSKISQLLERKCTPKKVSFTDENDFFDPIMVTHVHQTWRQWLEPLVTELPPVIELLDQLKPAIADLIKE